MSITDLQGQLKSALDSEDYELAARIRDVINKKKKS
jgi:protein-arginine kinase activator protein McsA